MASAASEPDPHAKAERTWATLAFRQSSGVKGFLVPDEPGGYWASAPRWVPVDISSWKRLPTWLTAMMYSQPVVPIEMPYERMNSNAGCPGITLSLLSLMARTF